MARILYVDDDINSRDIMSYGISVLGHEPLLASNGIQAINIVITEQPDLVILDYKMPGLNGIETLQRIRSLPKGKHLRIIICSGFDSEALKEQAICEGANEYVIKPIGLNELEALVA